MKAGFETAFPMKGVGKLLNQEGEILFVSRIELFPIDHDTRGFRIA